MRRMTKFVHGTEGSVSIFLLVIIFCFVSLGGVLIDGIRVRTAKQRLELGTEAAVDSILAEYGAKLANEYGIMVYTGKEDGSTKRAKEVIETHASSVENTFSMAILENVEVALETGSILNPKVDSNVLEDQMLENAKYTGVYTLGKGMLETLGFFKDNINDIEGVQDVIENQEKITKLVNERNSALKEVEKKTGGLKDLKNVISNNSTNLGKEKLAIWGAESCLGEVLIGSSDLGDGPLKEKIDDLKALKTSYEGLGDSDMATKCDNMIITLENIKSVIEATDTTGTNNLKNLLSAFTKESANTDKVIEALQDASKKIDEAEKKNKEINDIIKNLKKSEMTGELRTSLETIVMEEDSFTEAKQKITEAKNSYDKYKLSIMTIERKLSNYINGVAKIGRPTITYTHIDTSDIDEEKYDDIERSIMSDINTAQGKLVGMIGTGILSDLSDYNSAVTEGKSVDMALMVKRIEVVNSWAKDKQYEEKLTQEEQDKKDGFESEADKSFTELLDALNKLEGVADDQGIYNELYSIVSTMQDISSNGTSINTDSMNKMYEQTGGFIDKIKDMLGSVGKKALVNEYLLNEIGSKQPKDMLEDITGNMSYANKKVEFVIYGQYVSGANYALSIGEIALFRLLMNSVAAFRDDFVNIFKGHPIAYMIMVLAYAIVHTAKDIKTLGKSDSTVRSQREVELVPNFTNKLGSNGIKWTYKDHLRIILLCHPRGGQYERVVAVMENDIGLDKLASKPTQVKVESSATVRLWFLPTITKSLLGGQGVNVSPNELKLTTVKYGSY